MSGCNWNSGIGMIFNFLQTKDRRGLNYTETHGAAISLQQTPGALSPNRAFKMSDKVFMSGCAGLKLISDFLLTDVFISLIQSWCQTDVRICFFLFLVDICGCWAIFYCMISPSPLHIYTRRTWTKYLNTSILSHFILSTTTDVLLFTRLRFYIQNIRQNMRHFVEKSS